ncbi:MAG: ATP-dependent RNA helicase HrpA [Propionibacteriaceae bacterium]|nr:ATP-dependent RNA helicase HrpA [Propionibacteriaceae bacterium]
MPNLTVDPSLPIAAHQAEIAALILGYPVVIVAGETGSGKTTQLPKIALALGRQNIGHTQPRRIAARSVASRIAEETGTQLGELVGYQVRFVAQTGRATQLKVMTDGILLAEIAHDPLLRHYDTIIVDEAHERSLNIDFLLGFLKQLLERRDDLKVIITSATIDTQRFSRHFGNAPIVEVSGRGYPIEVRYQPVGDADQPDAIVKALRTLPPNDDTLVFLAGEREIRDAAATIEGARLRDTHVLPLYARLTMDEQARIFAPHEGRRVVLATNVAETSLTVPGIRCVIDPGFARIARYSARAKVQRLPIEPISRASADQRAGRCGRVAPGICVRLYSQEDYESRPLFTEPEILRTNLASVILAMTQARLGDIADFPFVDAPDRRHVDEGVRLLAELGAITGGPGDLRLTRIGRRLAELPIDPALARIILEGDARGCLREAIVIAAGLSVPDVRERPFEKREAADISHARFASDEALVAGVAVPEPVATPAEPARITVHTGWGAYRKKGSQKEAPPPATGTGGDVGAMLRLWAYLGDAQRDLNGSQFRKLCQREFFSYMRVREWQDLVSQLRNLARGMKMHAHAEPAPIDDVLKACLAGLLSHIGALQPPPPTQKRRGPREYLGARGARFAIGPDSALARSTPDFVVAVELVETSRLWAHTVAEIDPTWAEELGAALVRYTYSEPYYSAKGRAVLCERHATLFGVPLATRRIDFQPIDPDVARAIFIRSALVEDQLTARMGSRTEAVIEHNTAVKTEIEHLETKLRRRGLLTADDTLADWFDARLPADVASGAALERWLRSGPDALASLQLSVDDLLASEAPAEEDFPDTWVVGPTTLGLDYRFAPGESLDGVTVDVALTELADLPSAPFTWGVPGQRLDLATGLIRSLPKAVRQHVVPAPDFAARALAWLGDHADFTKPFPDELGRALTAITGVPIDGFDISAVPAHLRFSFRVDDGKHTHVSQDLPVLQDELIEKVHRRLAKSAETQARSGAAWVFEVLPETVRLRRDGLEVAAFPALQDGVTAARVTYAANLAQAKHTHRGGVVRLAALNLPDLTKGAFANLGSASLATLATGPYRSVADLLADARLGALGSLFDDLGGTWTIRDEAAFARALQAVGPRQAPTINQYVALATQTLTNLGKVETALDGFNQSSALVQDINSQVGDLVFDGFLRTIPEPWLRRVPVWLDGVTRRLQTALTSPSRDEAGMAQLTPVLGAYDQAPRDLLGELDEIGYLIEELRLQIFAQPVKTIQTVSVKRLMARLAAL